MITEYFWILTIIIIIFSFLIWYFCNSKIQNPYLNINKVEYFEPRWVETLKSLNFTNKDLNNFTNQLNNSNNPDEVLNNIISISLKKGLPYEKIFKSLVGEKKEEFTFVPSNPFDQSFSEL